MRVELTFAGLQSASFPERRVVERVRRIELLSPGWKPGALPIDDTRLVDPVGVEPTTSCLQGRCSPS